jgi:hypothetical protein
MRKLGVGTTRSTRLAGRCAAEEHGDCSVPQGWVEGRVRLASKVNNQRRFKRKLFNFATVALVNRIDGIHTGPYLC